MNSDKNSAYKFLTGMESFIAKNLPSRKEIVEMIPRIVTQAKKREDWKHKRTPEDAFLYHFAFPLVFQYIKQQPGMDKKSACQVLLSEFYRNMPQFSAGTPARKGKHPFGKIMREPTFKTIARWRGETEGALLKQSCPDFALRAPFPHTVVFEGKYFRHGQAQAAATSLVTDIYQAFFYRALPKEQSTKTHAEWNYDYACLFAYDGSDTMSLIETWQTLHQEVKRGFWDGANIYVMIFG
ncbi:MAG: hypothetical protein IID52_03465 [Proteobacteria bacterium]|nr:hypothetical protein [Pseudomonadota bacterium]